jgi:hypothetical protein
MIKSSDGLRRFMTICGLGAVIAGCGSDLSTIPLSVTGTFRPSVFLVTPPGRPMMDVLTQGGALSISITSTNVIAGTLTLPASVTGSVPLTASMSGDAVVNGNTVKFQQSADTFVRDLTWTIKRDTLEAINQVVAGATYSITMTKR